MDTSVGVLAPGEEVFDKKDSLLERLTELALEKRYVFRGYSLQEQMLPGLIRNDEISIELDLLFQFEKYASQYVRAYNPMDFLSHAQHYGLSTRLLDFTYNPFVALYFSTFKKKPNNANVKEDREYYYIRYCDTNTNLWIEELPIFNEGDFAQSFSMAEKSRKLFKTLELLYYPKDEMDKSKRKAIVNAIATSMRNARVDSNEIEKRIHNERVLLIDPNQSNQRIIMQQGLFMLCYSFEEEKHWSIINSNTRLIKIHKKLRDDLRAYLNTIGVNAFRLMPDLSNVCDAVERQVKEDFKNNKPVSTF